MRSRLLILTVFGCTLIPLLNAATIASNLILNEPRISSNDELLQTIVDNCFNTKAFSCIQEKVLNYLDTLNGIPTESARSLNKKNMDKLIYDRLQKIISTNEFKFELPQSAMVSYRADRGLDFDFPKEEGRGGMIKKKLLLPVLLLLKLKMKALMPILIGIVGLKAMKALILSKIAIKLVLGFLIYNLVQKLGGMKMAMSPMMMAAPEAVYGAPPASTPASTYGEPTWDSGNSPYSRWDSTNSGSAQSLAYSSYYPSSSSSATGASSSSSGSPSSSSSSSPSSSSSYSSYTS